MAEDCQQIFRKKKPGTEVPGEDVLGEIRTRVGGVKGLCPGPLDDEDLGEPIRFDL